MERGGKLQGQTSEAPKLKIRAGPTAPFSLSETTGRDPRSESFGGKFTS
jgi:hypothetical protein